MGSEMVGRVVAGKYRILSVMGGGGTATVYLGEDVRDGERWAVKEIRIDPAAEPDEAHACRAMFEREAQFLEKLSHPSIPCFREHFSEGDSSYIVMERIEGQDLDERLEAEPPPWPEKRVIEAAIALCDILRYLHAQAPPVLFRDLKPSNIMVAPGGALKLLDFGIARCFALEQRTDTLRMGTVGYAPPEQYGGKGGTDVRSDVYALGGLMHYLLTGKNPERSAPFTFLPVRELNPGVSMQMANAVERCVENEKENRPSSVTELSCILKGLDDLDDTPAFLPRRRILPRVRLPAMKPGLALAALPLVILLFIAFFIAHRSPKGKPPPPPTGAPVTYDIGIPEGIPEFMIGGMGRGWPDWSVSSMMFCDESMWMGTTKLSRDAGMVLQRSALSILDNFELASCIGARDGTLYYFSRREGVCRYRNGTIDVILPFESNELLLDPVQALACDAADRLFVLRLTGVSIYDRGAWKHLEAGSRGVREVSRIAGTVHPSREDKEFFARAHYATSEDLRGGTSSLARAQRDIMTDDEAEYSPFIVDGALARMEFSSYHGGGGKVYRRGGGRLHLMGDTSGRIWIWGGSSDPLKRRNGLWLLEKGTLRMLCLQDGLPGEAIYSVAEDRQGGIWAGGKVQAPGRGGVARFFEGKWESWNLARVIPGEPEAHIVGCVRADPAEGVWASTEQGLARFRGGRWRNVPLPGGLFDRRPSGLRDHIYPYYTYDRQISNFWVSPLGWLWLQRRDARGSPRGFFLLKDDRWYVVRGRR